MALAEGLDTEDRIGDDELLYRCVKRVHWKREGDSFRLSSQAFTDRYYRISVDRANLCGNDPSNTQMDDTDYVRSLLTADVRATNTVIKYENNVPLVHHNVDVESAPLPDNTAHAEIYTDPEISSKGVFRRLQERLICLSRWEDGFGPEPEEKT